MMYLLVTCLCLFNLFFRSAFTYEDPRATYCDMSATTYTLNSSFSTDLSLTLSSLPTSTPATGFHISTHSTATSAALCRATISSSDCQACIDAAVIAILSACPNRTSAQVWYTLCMVRYSNTNFTGQSNDTIAFTLVNVFNVPDQNLLDSKVDAMIRNLSYSAGVLSEKRYSVGRTNMTSDETIYGYVDCTRDVSGGDCTRCLLKTLEVVPRCCGGKWAGWVATPTCNIQFNLDPVDHDDWKNNPPYIDTGEYTTTPVPSNSPSSSKTQESQGTSSKIVMIPITIVVIILASVAVVLLILVVVKRKLNRERHAEELGVEAEDHDEIEVRSFMYSFHEIVAATKNFSIGNRLGEGGFGTVYRGKMASGEEIAVKRLTAGSSQGCREFTNEVRVLLKMQHRNLVKLLGYCTHSHELMLVYEYLPNTSLDRILFDKSKSALLDWPKRWNIITGVARGLLYLHEDSQLKTVHRDIKASNILLDQQLNPKISDFGIAKLLKDDQTRLRTGRIVGTFGYMAPEYAVRGMVTTKGDVFSFGVLMLEIISGRKNIDLEFDDEERELLNLTRRLDRENKQMELVDETIGNYPLQDVLRCIKAGLLCCQEKVQNRPTMSLALTLLTSHSTTFPSVGRIAYQASNTNNSITSIHDHGNPIMDFSSSNSNTITFSLVEGR